MTANNAADPGRRHDIDALRVFAFGLLILYHVGMFYVLDWDYHVKSDYQAKWLQLPMLLSNQWRMPLIFLISGLAVNFIWGKYHPAIFALRRSWRLFVPLIFGMAVIIAPQNYYEALSNSAIERGFLDFFGQYLSGQDFPPQAYDGDDTPGWTWNHLWYLPYLLSYTLLLIPIAMFMDGLGKRVRKAIRHVRGVWLIVLPIGPLILYGNLIFPNFPYISHAFSDDWYAHAMYFTFFLYGYLIGRDAGVWAELQRLRKLTFRLAVVSFMIFYALKSDLTPDNIFTWRVQLEMVVTYLNRWLWIITILGWGRQLLNRPFHWLPYATEAVYPWYILHQTIILTVGYELSQLQLGAVMESALVLIATFAGCLLIHEFLVRRIAWLRMLFGLQIGKRRLEPSDSRVERPNADTYL